MAHMWRPDPLMERERKMDSYKRLHRLAMDRGWWCMPRQSNIDKRQYYAEINFNATNEDGTYKHTVPNLKLGVGDTGLEAAAIGYVMAMPDDLVIREAAIVARLEALIPLLEIHADGRARYLKVVAALDDLTDLLAMVKTAAPAPAGETEKPKPDEDDDL